MVTKIAEHFVPKDLTPYGINECVFEGDSKELIVSKKWDEIFIHSEKSLASPDLKKWTFIPKAEYSYARSAKYYVDTYIARKDLQCFDADMINKPVKKEIRDSLIPMITLISPSTDEHYVTKDYHYKHVLNGVSRETLLYLIPMKEDSDGEFVVDHSDGFSSGDELDEEDFNLPIDPQSAQAVKDQLGMLDIR